MINRIVLLILVLAAFSSCNETTIFAEAISFDQAQLAKCANIECPEVSVDYLKYGGDENVVRTINDSITKFIVQSLYLDDPEITPSAKTVEEAVKDFVAMYWTHSSEFPEINEYFAEVSVTESLKSKEFLSLAMKQYSYTGGAHGYESVDYKNFDAETGIALTPKDLFKDVSDFTRFAETKFREAFKIKENESINADKFWFEEDTFYLPTSIGFTKKKLVLYYNQYDIASYADGPVIVEIPLKDTTQYLNYSIEQD